MHPHTFETLLKTQYSHSLGQKLPMSEYWSATKELEKRVSLTIWSKDEWPSEGCACLHVKLSETGPSPVKFGETYYDNPIEQRLHKCKLLAIELIADKIYEHFDTLFSTYTDFPVAECASLLKTICSSLFPKDGRFHAIGDAEVVDYARTHDPVRFQSFLLYFMVQHEQKIHAKFVVDELDDQDALFILALSERLARLRDEFDNFSKLEIKSNGSAPQRCLTTLIACRKTTFSYVSAMQEILAGMDWFNFYRINIDSASLLGDILVKRYRAHVEKREIHGGDIKKLTLKFGIQERQTIIEYRDEFFIRLFTAMSKTKKGTQMIVQLCNNDLSESLSATLDVLRNRYPFFIRTDGIFQVVSVPVGERVEQAEKLLTPTTVLRCLAYGSQELEFPVYPICHTRVPNPLRSSVLPDNNKKTSLVKIRLLSWFNNRQSQSPTSGFSPTIETIVSTMSRYFGLQPKYIKDIVDEMHAERLLEHSHGLNKPSSYGDGCVLSMTPRASCLWQELGENSVILQCHREVTDLDPDVMFQKESHTWCLTRTYVTDIKKWFADLPWLCAQLWMTERKHFVELNDNLVHDFVSEFGTTFVSSYITNGITENINSFFRFEIRDKDLLNKVLHMCAALRSECQDVLESRLEALERRSE